jgi:hypothetical protein
VAWAIARSRLLKKGHLGNETCCAGGILSDRASQDLAVTHQGVDVLGHTQLGRHPQLQQSLEPADIELNQKQPEGRVRRWLGDRGGGAEFKPAELDCNLIEQVSHLISVVYSFPYAACFEIE